MQKSSLLRREDFFTISLDETKTSACRQLLCNAFCSRRSIWFTCAAENFFSGESGNLRNGSAILDVSFDCDSFCSTAYDGRQ